MKKIAIVLLMALALVSMATAEVVVSGELDYGFMADADFFAGKFDKIEVDLNADVDENNSIAIEIEDKLKTNDLTMAVGGGTMLGASTGFGLGLSYATLTTDWGAILDLPMGVTSTVGYDEFNVMSRYTATGWLLEEGGRYLLSTEAAVKLTITPSDTVTIGAATTFDRDNDMVFGANVDIDPIGIGVNYATAAGGKFGTSVGFGMELSGDMTLDAAGYLDYAIDPSTYDLGFGVGFGVAGALIGVGFEGNDVDILESLGADLNYGLTDELSTDVAMAYSIKNSELLSIDFSATYAAGAATYTLGYLVTDGFGADWDYNAITSLADGGVYFNATIDF